MSERSMADAVTVPKANAKAKRRPTRYKPGFLLCFTVALLLVVIGGFLNLRALIVEPSQLSLMDKVLILGVGLVLTGLAVLFSYFAWGILRSMRFAVSLIVILTLASVAGILIKQHDFNGPDRIHPSYQAKIAPEVAERFSKEKFKLAAIPDATKREQATLALRKKLRKEVQAKYQEISFFDNFLHAESFFLWNLWHKGFNILGNKIQMDPQDKAMFERKAHIFGARAASDWWDMQKIRKNGQHTKVGVDALAHDLRIPMKKFYSFCEALDLTRVWKSNWFSMLFFLIFVVVSINTFRPAVWKWKRLGFLVSHLSIVVMLVGTTLSRRTEVRGSAELVLGKNASTPIFVQFPRDGTFRFKNDEYYRYSPFQEGMVLRAEDFKADYHKKLFVTGTDESGALTKRFKVAKDKVIPLFNEKDGPRYRIKVKDYQPRVRPHWGRVPDPSAPFDPVLTYRFSLQRGESLSDLGEKFLRASSSKAFGVFYPLMSSDELKLAFVWPKNEDERRYFLQGLAAEGLGNLVLSKHPNGQGTKIPLSPRKALADLEYEGKHFQVAILDATPDFKAESFGKMSERAKLRDSWRYPKEFDSSYNIADAFREGLPNNPALFVRVDLLDTKGQVRESEYRLIFADPRSNDHGRGVPMASGKGDPHSGGASPHGGAGHSALAALPLSFEFDYVRAPSKHTLLVVGGKGKKPTIIDIHAGRASPPKTWNPKKPFAVPLGGQDVESLKEFTLFLNRCEVSDRSRLVASYEALPNDDFFHHDPAGIQLEISGPKGTKEFTIVLSSLYSEIGVAPPIPPEVQVAEYDEHLKLRFGEDRMMLPIDWKTKLEIHQVEEPFFQCADGKFLVVPMVDDSDFEAVRTAWAKLKKRMSFFVDFPATGEPFSSKAKRMENLKTLKDLFREWFLQIPSSNWLSALKDTRTMTLDSYLALPGSKPVAKRTIRVNEPLVYGSFFDSWRFTQSNADDQRPFYTGIGVQRDGGVLLVLVSMYALGIGTILMFIILPLLKRKRRGGLGSVDEELGFETVKEA
jgi:hypothetical protein